MNGETPALRFAWIEEMAGLGSKKTDGLLGFDGGAHYCAGVGVNAGGDVDGNDGFLRLIDGFDPCKHISCYGAG